MQARDGQARPRLHASWIPSRPCKDTSISLGRQAHAQTTDLRRFRSGVRANTCPGDCCSRTGRKKSRLLDLGRAGPADILRRERCTPVGGLAQTRCAPGRRPCGRSGGDGVRTRSRLYPGRIWRIGREMLIGRPLEPARPYLVPAKPGCGPVVRPCTNVASLTLSHGAGRVLEISRPYCRPAPRPRWSSVRTARRARGRLPSLGGFAIPT